MSKSTSLRVGIAGLGTVGAGAAHILQMNADLISRRAGRPVQVTAVSSRDREKDRGFDLKGIAWCDGPLALCQRDDVDVIVEAIGGSEGVALDLVKNALQAGKHVVTANKALLAEHGHELAEVAASAGKSLGFEAAVCGGIPAIKGLREGLAANRILSVHGIMNGTCNYMMTEMREKGLAFDAVLKIAQDLGYAEADPGFDIDGIDAAHKLALVAALAFGAPVDFSAVKIDGIRSITSEDTDFASELGFRIKLITSACLVGDEGSQQVAQVVRPAFVRANTALGSVEGVDNAVLVQGNAVGEVMLRGPGAGGGATGSAIVADLIDIARDIHVPFLGQDPSQTELTAGQEAWLDMPSAFYLRLSVKDQAGVLAKIATCLADANVSIDSMIQRDANNAGTATMAIKTHKSTRRSITPALQALESLPQVLAPIQALDILDL